MWVLGNSNGGGGGGGDKIAKGRVKEQRKVKGTNGGQWKEVVGQGKAEGAGESQSNRKISEGQSKVGGTKEGQNGKGKIASERQGNIRGTGKGHMKRMVRSTEKVRWTKEGQRDRKG